MARINQAAGLENPLQNVFPQPVVSARAPTSNDKKYPLGQTWVDTASTGVYFLTAVSAGAATWALASPGASDVDTLTGDSGGALSPSGGNITLAGTANQITTTGSGSTITWSLPAAITTPGSLTATSSLAATTTVTAGTDITATAGDIAATAGSVTAGTTVTGGTGVVATTGGVTATAGGVTATAGDITATAGDIVATAGNIEIEGAGSYLAVEGGAATDFIGQATLSSGTITVANSNITTADRIILTRADANSSSALGELTITALTGSTSFVITALDPSDGSSTITGDTSIVNYFIVRQL